MFALSLFSALALSALSSNALVLPRIDSPSGWATGYLEDYQTYHTRYLALGCTYQHGKPFFDTCCHPMLASENLQDNRAPECTPSPSASASAAAVVASDDCEEEDDDEPAPAPPAPEPTPAPTSSAEPAPVTSAAAPATSAAPEPTTSAEPEPAPAPTSTKKQHAPSSSSSAPESTQPPSGSSSGSSGDSSSSSLDLSGLITGGFGTFFYQNGVAGACGTVHSDDDLIVAMDTAQYGETSRQSSLCGKKVQIFNAKNNKSVTCTIADACPTCNNGNSIDLSVGAFKQLASLDEGLIDISWKLL